MKHVLLFLLGLSSLFAEPALCVFATPEEVGAAIADQIAERLKEPKPFVLGLATGSSPIPLYQALKKKVREERLDLSQLITFNLDEYVDLPEGHPQSYRAFMFATLFDDLLPYGLKLENIHLPTETGCQEYEELLTQTPIDLQILGIGPNGHIGFDEPGTPFDSATQVVALTEETRAANARFFDSLAEVPKRAVTMGIGSILKAKQIILIATGAHKASIIAQALQEPISPAVPATALRLHAQASFYLDENAASALPIVCFKNGKVLKNGQIETGEVWVRGGKIIAPASRADRVIDVSGRLIAPGLIDLQINGAFGCDFSQRPTDVERVARALTRTGVTAFLPTVVSSTPAHYRAILPALQPRAVPSGATLLGIHLEGPFFSPLFQGAHNRHFLSAAVDPEEMYGSLEGVKIVTLAPEIDNAASLIASLKKRNIVISAGHSNATFAEMQQATAAGVALATHLFNAMRSYHHREPGLAATALLSPDLSYSLILDGAHLAPETVRLCWRCHPEGLLLVTDATAALGLPDGPCQLGTLDTEVIDGKVYVRGTHTLAGSALSLDAAVRELIRITGCSAANALDAASRKPAELLRLYPQKGSLEIGADADLILLSDTLHVEATYVSGRLAWQKSPALFYWDARPRLGFSNFGDALSEALVEKLAGHPLSIARETTPDKFLAVGSILHYAQDGDLIWGAGVNGKSPDTAYRFSTLDVRAVRGPLTRDFLLQRNIPCPPLYGDPTLLLPRLFPEWAKDPQRDYLLIPHYSEEHLFAHDPHFVSVKQDWRAVVSHILQSRFVISSALSGLIVAEAFGIPARLLLTPDTTETLFKYTDYYAGTGRPTFRFATSVEEALQMGGEPPPVCDLDALEQAFPHDRF